MIDSGSLYFLFLTAGLALGMGWFLVAAERRGHPRVLLIDMCLACLLGAILGSRVLYVATEPLPAYEAGPGELEQLRRIASESDDAELRAALSEALAHPPVAMPWLFVAQMPPGEARSEAIRRTQADPSAVPARLWFRAYPWEAFAFWKGGLVYLGGVAMSVVLCVLVILRHKGQLPELADLAAPGIQLGSGFGRLGCVSSGCCYGAVCEPHWWSTPLPWLKDVLGTEPRYPTAFLLLLLSGVSFLVLRARLRRRAFAGEVFLLMFVLYGAGRFGIEHLRDDPRGHWALGLSTSQLISLGTAVPAAGLLVWGRLKGWPGPRDALSHSAQGESPTSS